MSDTQTRLDVTSREFLEAWLVGADFPMAATVKLLLGAHDARVAELERVTAALREYQDCASWYIRCLEDVQDRRPVRGLAEAKAGYDSARAALAGGARAAQEDK
jgi:hypothetical protein